MNIDYSIFSCLNDINGFIAPSFPKSGDLVPTLDYLTWQAGNARKHVAGRRRLVWVIDDLCMFTGEGVVRRPSSGCFLAAGVLGGEDAEVATLHVEIARARLAEAGHKEVMFVRGQEDDTWAMLIVVYAPQEQRRSRLNWRHKLELLFEAAWAGARARRTGARGMVATYGLDGYAREWLNQPRPKGIRRRAAKQCFNNALSLMLDRPELVYVEGFAGATDEVPVQNAWTIDLDGRVIDPTWPHDPRVVYCGVPFMRRWAAGALIRRGECGDALRIARQQLRFGKATGTDATGASPAGCDPADVIDFDALHRFDVAQNRPA